MKHLKIVALAFAATAALMAFASSASATVLTSPSGTEYTGALEFTATASLKFEAGFATDTCTSSTVSGNVTTNTTVASGAISTLSFSGCSFTTDILRKGELEVKSGGEFILRGNEWTTSTLGTSCVYGGGTGTKLGTLTGGTPARLVVSASLPKLSGGSLCGNPEKWTGEYTVTNPGTLLVD